MKITHLAVKFRNHYFRGKDTMTVIQPYEESYPKYLLGKTFPALSIDTVLDLTILDILCDKSDFVLSLLK